MAEVRHISEIVGEVRREWGKETTHASLCTGIGGFDYAAKLLGWQNVFQCEIDPFCREVLRYWFPDCELFEDLRSLRNLKKYENRIDVISAGFPCKPFSCAGKRKGTDDDRYLWDEVFRVIQAVSPRWFVGENVCGLLNQQSGVVFEGVCADLEDAGYEVQPFVIPACAVDAPHKRDRVWIVAANGANAGFEGLRQTWENGVCEREIIDNAASHENNRRGQGRLYAEPAGVDAERFITNANVAGLQRKGDVRQSERSEQSIFTDAASSGRLQNDPSEQSGKSEQDIPDWRQFPTQSPVCGKYDGISFGLADIAFPTWRRQSIKALGNAVVPQVVYEIFKTIEKVEQIKNQENEYRSKYL